MPRLIKLVPSNGLQILIKASHGIENKIFVCLPENSQVPFLLARSIQTQIFGPA